MSHSVLNGQLNLSTASIRDSTFKRSQRSEFSMLVLNSQVRAGDHHRSKVSKCPTTVSEHLWVVRGGRVGRRPSRLTETSLRFGGGSFSEEEW